MVKEFIPQATQENDDVEPHGHPNVVWGLYYVNRQGETYVCLVNETADEVVIGDKALLGEHIPTAADDMITLGELLMVKEEASAPEAPLSEEKMKVIDNAIEGQVHLSAEQKEQLRQVLVCQHEAVSLSKSDIGRSAAVPHVLRPKSEEPAQPPERPYTRRNIVIFKGAKLQICAIFCANPPHTSTHAVDLRKKWRRSATLRL